MTLDYRDIGRAGDGLHIEELPLAVRMINEAELDVLLADVEGHQEILQLIEAGVPQVETGDADEFGPGSGGESEPPTTTGTWTLVVLTALKDAGRKMEPGRIRRMLRTALPLGDSISIVYSGDPLVSVKLDVPLQEEWAIGQDMGIDSVELLEEGEDEPVVFAVSAHSTPYPHVTIEGIDGPITGTVRLFERSISGGKSSLVGASNGFFVNILGRVINAEDPYFGLSNLNHSAWAKTRVAVRADGLNDEISVDRERALRRSGGRGLPRFLLAIFNKVRSAHDASERAGWPDAGEILREAWGTVPLRPLQRVLEERRTEGREPPPFVTFDVEGREEAIERWHEAEPSTDPIRDIEFVETGPDAPLVRYDPVGRMVTRQ